MAEFPVTIDMILTVGGLAFIVAAVIELAKPYIKKLGADLWVNLAAWALAEALAVVGTGLARGWAAEALYEAFVLGVLAALAATGGYEAVKNLGAFVGWHRGEG